MEFNWWSIASLVLLVVSGALGTWFSSKWKHMCNVLKEIGDVFIKSSEALEDKKITKEEALSILKEYQDVAYAVMILLNRKL